MKKNALADKCIKRGLVRVSKYYIRVRFYLEDNLTIVEETSNDSHISMLAYNLTTLVCLIDEQGLISAQGGKKSKN